VTVTHPGVAGHLLHSHPGRCVCKTPNDPQGRLSFFALFDFAPELVSEQQSLRLVFAVPPGVAAVVAPQWHSLGVADSRPVVAAGLLPLLGVGAIGPLLAVELLLPRWTRRLPLAVQL
jgi:hypothetical protein